MVGAKRGRLARRRTSATRPADSPLPGSERTTTASRTSSRTARGWRRPRRTLDGSLTASPTPRAVGRLGRDGARDRLANLGLLVAAGVAWILVALLVTTRDPYQDAMAGYVGALLIGARDRPHRRPAGWLVVFARHRRIAYQGDWFRAARRGAWVGLFVAILVVLRLVDAFQLPIVLFLAAIFIVAELTLSAER